MNIKKKISEYLCGAYEYYRDRDFELDAANIKSLIKLIELGEADLFDAIDEIASYADHLNEIEKSYLAKKIRLDLREIRRYT